MVVADPRNPLLIDVAERAGQVFEDEGLATLLISAKTSSRPAWGSCIDDRGIGVLKDLGVEAVLVVGSVPGRGALPEVLGDIPVVVAAADADGLRADQVRSDDRLGMRLVVDYLVAQGHTAIAHLGGLGGDVAEDRAVGYRAGMAHHGLSSAIVVADSDFSDDAGYRGAAQLLRGPRPVTAITAVNDLAAVGAMSAIADAGLRVPCDVAVTGYDDTFVSAIRQVSLTSVDSDRSAVGSLAAYCVLRRITDPGQPAQEHLLPPRLVTRYSTGAPVLGVSTAGQGQTVDDASIQDSPAPSDAGDIDITGRDMD